MSTPQPEATQPVAKAIPPTVKEHFEAHKTKLLLTKERFEKIKANLLKTINAMDQAHSMFSRAARYWAEVHLWKKIVAGVALTVPFFVIGVAAHIAVFLTISIYTVFSYTASSILLDNHHSETKSNTENLRDGVNGLADLLGEIIESLGILREQLATEISRLHTENVRLSANVTQLSEEVRQLAVIGKDLKLTNVDLDASVKKQAELLKQAEATQLKLSEDLKDIKSLNELFKTQNQQWMAELTDKNKEAREAYGKKLADFLKDGTKSFDQLTTRICEAEIKLAATSEELKLRVKEHQDLLVEHRRLIAECTELAKTLKQAQPNTETPQPVIKFATLLEGFGVNALHNGATHPRSEGQIEAQAMAL